MSDVLPPLPDDSGRSPEPPSPPGPPSHTSKPQPAASESEEPTSGHHRRLRAKPFGIAGVILALVAVVPPAWYTHHLATVPSSTFREAYGLASLGYGLGFLFLMVVEVVLLVPATVLSLMGVRRARTWPKTESRRHAAHGQAGLALAFVALILTISSMVVLGERGG